SSAGHKGRTWKANLDATNLVARTGEQTIVWQEPINVNLSAYRGQQGPVIERASCRSKFLTVEGSGSLDRLKLTAHADLAQLVSDIGRFIDTSGVSLQGTADLTLHSTVANQTLDVRGNADLKNLDIVWNDKRLWREDTARAELKASGTWRDKALVSVDSARLDIFGDREQAVVRLEKPITNLAEPGAYELRAGYGGRFSAWPARLAMWLGEAPSLPFGDNDAVSLDSFVRYDGKTVAASSAKLTVTPLVVTGGRPTPRAATGLEITAAGDWDIQSSLLRLENVVAKSAGWTIRAPQFVYALSGSAPLAVDATLQGDLRDLEPWFGGTNTTPSVRLAGKVDGRVKLAHGDSQSTLIVDGHVADFVAASATGQRWDEKRLAINAHAAWDAANQRWNIGRANVAGKDLSADARGHVTIDDKAYSLDMTGEVNYDLAKLSIFVQSYLGKSFAMKGRDALQFSVRGKVPTNNREDWSGLTGHATFAWEAAQYQGFHAGPVKVDAKVADGRIDLGRIQTSINDGKLDIQPVVHLTKDGPVLTVAKGRVIDKVKITPEMCESGIKYALPALADVTQAEGSLSIAIDRCVVPLTSPERAEVLGQIVSHKAVVSPSQVIAVLAVLQQVPTLLRIEPEDVIPIQVSRGRVYHKDLTMILGRDVKVNSTGSVGFDNTLDLVVQAPIPRSLLDDRSLGEAASRQRIDIRITGTLDRPKVDRDAVRRTIAKFASGTLNDVINKEIGNALDRLLRPR
ncbi:MAG: hypothetical protein MI757_08110, partial [Pirellulales bacterium]|nr:hypothetical protein [Pirellulales bacterium]